MVVARSHGRSSRRAASGRALIDRYAAACGTGEHRHSDHRGHTAGAARLACQRRSRQSHLPLAPLVHDRVSYAGFMPRNGVAKMGYRLVAPRMRYCLIGKKGRLATRRLCLDPSALTRCFDPMLRSDAVARCGNPMWQPDISDQGVRPDGSVQCLWAAFGRGLCAACFIATCK